MGKNKQYDEKGNGAHYLTKRLNAIHKYERSYGTLGTMVFCEITADKYRDRIGKKEDQPIEQEVLKIEWYERAAAFYFAKLGTPEEIKVDNRKRMKLPWDK